MADTASQQSEPQGERRAALERFLASTSGASAVEIVGLAPLRREFGGAGPALVHVGLQIRCVDRKAGRTAVHHASERRAVTFAEARDREHAAEGIA